MIAIDDRATTGVAFRRAVDAYGPNSFLAVPAGNPDCRAAEVAYLLRGALAPISCLFQGTRGEFCVKFGRSGYGTFSPWCMARQHFRSWGPSVRAASIATKGENDPKQASRQR